MTCWLRMAPDLFLLSLPHFLEKEDVFLLSHPFSGEKAAPRKED